MQQVRGLNLQELNAIFKGLGIDGGGSSSKGSAMVEQEETTAAPAFAPLKDVASAASTPPATLQEWEAAGTWDCGTQSNPGPGTRRGCIVM